MDSDPIYLLHQSAQYKTAARVQMENALESRRLSTEYRARAEALYPSLSLKEQKEFDETLAILTKEYTYGNEPI